MRGRTDSCARENSCWMHGRAHSHGNGLTRIDLDAFETLASMATGRLVSGEEMPGAKSCHGLIGLLATIKTWWRTNPFRFRSLPPVHFALLGRLRNCRLRRRVHCLLRRRNSHLLGRCIFDNILRRRCVPRHSFLRGHALLGRLRFLHRG